MLQECALVTLGEYLRCVRGACCYSVFSRTGLGFPHS